MELTIKKLNVEGMSCSHCERAIKDALSELDGVAKTEVDLSANTVTIEYDMEIVSESNLVETIEDAGYDVV